MSDKIIKDWIIAEINYFLLEFDIYTDDIPEPAVRRLADKIVEHIEDKNEQ